jgi:tetratricopeptide (TPR) repeat protein
MMPVIDTGLVFAGQALARHPGDARALALRGTLRYQAWASVPGAPPSLLDSARTDLVAATTSDPHLARAWSALGSVLQMQGDSAGAISALRNALAADVYIRDTPRTINQLIVAYLFAGKDDSARGLCTESARTYPRDPTLGPCELTVLGWTGRGTRDLDRTRVLVAEMERGGFWPLIGGMSPEARFFYAAVLARSGRRDSARAAAAETRRRLTAAGLPTSNSLGEAYVHVLLGDHSAALDALERGMANDSTLRDRATRLPWFTPLRGDARFRRLMDRG